MKKMLIALTAAAALTGSAQAADLAARPYTKAPMAAPAPVASWTGCYIGGGGGYGLWDQENTNFANATATTPRTQLSLTDNAGGRGWFGTVQGGCDYQFGLGSQQFVLGAFADADFDDIHGTHETAFTGRLNGFGASADEKMSSAWAVGGRVGWVVLPGLMTYFAGGYTEATFDRQDFFLNTPGGSALGFFLDKTTYHGWFLGGGDEYAVNFLPGLFWKTEYRLSEFNTKTNPFLVTDTGLATANSVDSHKWVQTIRSELVYRFNWGGPVGSRY